MSSQKPSAPGAGAADIARARASLRQEVERQILSSFTPGIQQAAATSEIRLETLKRLVSGLRAARTVGEMPAQPPTLRGRAGAWIVAAVRRALFWLFPQINTFNNAVCHTAAEQLAILDAVTAQLAQCTAALADLKERVDFMHRQLSASSSARESQNDTPAGDAFAEWYVAFEDQFRGSRALVKERVGEHLGRIQELLASGVAGPVLDLGCGRGEWLEALSEAGIACRGVDSNPAMVAFCQAQGLAVECADSLRYLHDQPPASCAAVTCIHMVEHLPFAQVMALLEGVVRVLKPGGILIAETPNPANLLVSSKYFYMDPTHIRPLPSELLRFAAETEGLETEAVLFLRPLLAPDGPAWPPGSVEEKLYGPQDYALISRKPVAS